MADEEEDEETEVSDTTEPVAEEQTPRCLTPAGSRWQRQQSA